MTQDSDFVIAPFKSRKHLFRSDKGKRHNYPKERKFWNLMCHGHFDSNLGFNQTGANSAVMDNNESFKHSSELREYWRLEKRKQRNQARVAKEAKTEQSRKLGGGERLV